MNVPSDGGVAPPLPRLWELPLEKLLLLAEGTSPGPSSRESTGPGVFYSPPDPCACSSSPPGRLPTTHPTTVTVFVIFVGGGDLVARSCPTLATSQTIALPGPVHGFSRQEWFEWGAIFLHWLLGGII